MNEIAVIREEKQTSRILIQPSDALQAPLDELGREKGKNTGMMLWLMGTFKA